MTVIKPQDRLMTVAEFLAWPGFDPNRHYQLIDGKIVEMAPARGQHNILIGRLAQHLNNLLEDSDLNVVPTGGIARSDQAQRWFETDLLVTTEPPSLISFRHPILIVEILSPSTADLDRTVKLPDYHSLPSVREIVLMDQSRPELIHHVRTATGGWCASAVTGMDATLVLVSVPLILPLRKLYRGFWSDEDGE